MKRNILHAAIVCLALGTSAIVAQEANPFIDPFGDNTQESAPNLPDPIIERSNPYVDKLTEFNESWPERSARFSKALEENDLEAIQNAFLKLASEYEESLKRLCNSGDEIRVQEVQLNEIKTELSALMATLNGAMNDLEYQRELASNLDRNFLQLQKQNQDLAEAISIMLQELMKTSNPDAIVNAIHMINLMLPAEGTYSGELKHARALQSTLLDLLQYSDSNVRNAAFQTLQAVAPDVATENGYQSADGFWHSLESLHSNPFSNDCSRAALQYEAWVDGDGTVEEALDFMSSDLSASVVWPADTEIKGKSTPNLREIPILDAITTILRVHGHGFVLHENRVEIYPIGSPELINGLTYDVRGLLSSELTLDSLAEKTRSAISDGEGIEITQLSESRIFVRATENQHADISRFLARIPLNF
ncbi:MAG: hypothetical protein R3C03_07105 [Pirellulaceae bacterium]